MTTEHPESRGSSEGSLSHAAAAPGESLRRLHRTPAGSYVQVWIEGGRYTPTPSPADVAAAIVLENAREGVERASRDAARAQDELRRAIATYRRKGATWDDVGRLFGITRQAAAKRFAPTDQPAGRASGRPNGHQDTRQDGE